MTSENEILATAQEASDEVAGGDMSQQGNDQQEKPAGSSKGGTMKKSNWIIMGILLVASIFFLWLWYALGMNAVDNPRDLVLTIVWWAAIVAGCVCIHKAEKKRQERVRTTFVAKGALFNSEAGLISLGGTTAVDKLQETLANLEYNFHMEDLPDKSKVKFDYIVRTKKFEVKKAEDKDAEGDAQALGQAAEQASSLAAEANPAAGEAGQAAQAAAGAVQAAAADATAELPVVEDAQAADAAQADDAQADEVKTWEGEVLDVAHPDDDPKPFKSREELISLLGGLAA